MLLFHYNNIILYLKIKLMYTENKTTQKLDMRFNISLQFHFFPVNLSAVNDEHKE